MSRTGHFIEHRQARAHFRALTVGGVDFSANDRRSPRDFGAACDGTTDDAVAANACAEACVSEGYDFLWPRRMRITAPIKFGLSRWQSIDAIVARTTGGLQPTQDNTNAADNLANRRQINMRCEAGATLIADFTAETPTPVIEYNIVAEGMAQDWQGGLTITTPAFVDLDGTIDRNNTTAVPDSNLIGLAVYGRAFKRVGPISFLGMGSCGLLGINNYGVDFQGMLAWACGDAANLSDFNAGKISMEPWYSTRGVVFDGTCAEVRLNNPQQCKTDLRMFRGEDSIVTASYMEDFRPVEDGTGLYSVDLGEGAGAARIICSTFIGLRTTPTTLDSTKRGYRFRDLTLCTLIGCRDYGHGVDVDALSNAILINCSFDETSLSGKRFLRLDSNRGGVQLPEFTAAELNALTASSRTGMIAYCSDGDTGSPCLALGDGSSFKRVALGATVAAT